MPNGQADAVQDAILAPSGDVQACFVLPHEERMPFEHFSAHLKQQVPACRPSGCSSCTPDTRTDSIGCSSDGRPPSSHTRPQNLQHPPDHELDSSAGQQPCRVSISPADNRINAKQAHTMSKGSSRNQQKAGHRVPPDQYTASNSKPSTQSQPAGAEPKVQHEVLYLQQQNSNLTNTEFASLHPDVELDIPWARDVFGGSPDACNLWIGNDCSTTSFHKDHYENLFAVVAGEKHFLLLPPCDVYRLYMQDFPVANTERSDKGVLQMRLAEPPSCVKWTPVDPFSPPTPQARASYSQYHGADMPQPFHVVVKAGDLLYLPCLWLHAVAQQPDGENKVIGVNFWYDMKFDSRYAYYTLVEHLADTFSKTT